MIPNVAQAAVDQNGHFTVPWRKFLAALDRASSQSGTDTSGLAADIAAIATALGSPDGSVAGIPEQDDASFVIVSPDGSVRIVGTPASGTVALFASVADGDKGDITVSGSGTAWAIDDGAVTESKLGLSDNTTANASTSAHGLLRKLTGATNKYLDASGNWSAPSATGGAGWQTALDLDFSAQASQTLATDGNYTIGGLTWTKANSANDSTAMAVTNGTGLVITPKSTSLYLGQTARTAPYLYTDLTSIIPSFYLEMPLRIWVYISADNVSAPGDAVGGVIDNMSTVANTCCLYIFRRAYNGGKSLEYNGAIAGSVSSFAANSALLDNSDRVMQFSLPMGRWSGTSALWAGADASGWPSPAALRPVYRNASSTSGLTSSQDIVTGLPMKLVLYAQRNGSGTALSATIKRVRIDFQST